MAENVNGSDLFGSGGHVWQWGEAPVDRKVLGSIGVVGEAAATLRVRSCPVTITGRTGSPAILKATGADRAEADAALDVLESAIRTLQRAGTQCSWEDDSARTGSALLIQDYRRQGGRKYSQTGGTWSVWQDYTVTAIELTGGPS